MGPQASTLPNAHSGSQAISKRPPLPGRPCDREVTQRKTDRLRPADDCSPWRGASSSGPTRVEASRCVPRLAQAVVVLDPTASVARDTVRIGLAGLAVRIAPIEHVRTDAAIVHQDRAERGSTSWRQTTTWGPRPAEVSLAAHVEGNTPRRALGERRCLYAGKDRRRPRHRGPGTDPLQHLSPGDAGLGRLQARLFWNHRSPPSSIPKAHSPLQPAPVTEPLHHSCAVAHRRARGSSPTVRRTRGRRQVEAGNQPKRCP